MKTPFLRVTRFVYDRVTLQFRHDASFFRDIFTADLTETLRQEYYAVGVGTVTSPAPPEASESARVPIIVQLLVQVCYGVVMERMGWLIENTSCLG